MEAKTRISNVRQEFGIGNKHKEQREGGFAGHGIDDLDSDHGVGLNQCSTDIDLFSEAETDSNLGVVVKPWNKDAYREERAGSVALIIAFAFAAFLFLSAALGGAIVLRRSPEEATQLIQAFSPFLESLGKSAALVFGPPLAFILGYYFRGRQR